MKKVRILSVDDEASFTELLKQYFELRGYEIDVTCEGTRALEMLREKRHEVVLLDLKMVGLDGDEVMHEIKDICEDSRIIFITAYSDSGKTRDRLLDEGAYAFMEKPVTSLKHLEDLINRAAERGGEEVTC